MSYPLPEATDDLASTLNVTTTNSTDASDTSFLVFDPRGRKILGVDPSLEHMFSTTPGVIQEAPVYVPELDAIIFSTFTPDVYPQSIIYLNETEPRLGTFYADPPVWGVNGGRYRDGKIYWAVAGSGDFRASNQTVGQTTGIYTLDPLTMKSTVLVNNYFGVPFNSPDDLVIDDRGDIFFTDPWYGWAMGVDILSEWGELLLHIQTNYTVNNVQFAGPKLDELWLFGMGGISRVRWDLAGLPQARS
ncbi:hypothetical protein SLS56_004505 [Neofusicoccum ribis]|uniref:SMP-30/Gluconolactonase/LRE-like region domain-containing protein n=1 Tax=Neofusicoccum ribis TaxID=45134 RepID=A0ABR3SXU0_9PEZI